MSAASTRRGPGLNIDYPVTRSLPGKWTGLAGYVGIVILLVFVAIVNVALVGYETLSEFRTDYNSNDPHWYHKFIPTFRPNQSCDPIEYNVGDRFTTKFSLFEWKIAGFFNSTHSSGEQPTHLAYKGQTLDRCALTSIQANSHIAQQQLECILVAHCDIPNGPGLVLGASMPISLGNPFEDSAFVNTGASQNQEALFVAQTLVSLGGYGILIAFRNTSLLATLPPTIRARYQFPYCPQVSPADNCLAEVLQPTVYNVTLPITEAETAPPEIWGRLVEPVWDFAQVALAATKLDFGNLNTRNNLFLNISVRDITLRSSRWSVVLNSAPLHQRLPLTLDDRASKIQTAFLCRFQKLKSSGSLFASVFAATSTLVTGAWGMSVLIATWLVKREKPDANLCEPHIGTDEGPDRKGSPTSLDPEAQRR